MNFKVYNFFVKNYMQEDQLWNFIIISQVASCSEKESWPNFTSRNCPGKKALIVTTGGTSMKKYGYLGRVEEQLELAGVSHLLFDKILPNPIKGTRKEGA